MKQHQPHHMQTLVLAKSRALTTHDWKELDLEEIQRAFHPKGLPFLSIVAIMGILGLV